jgi:hypothetical protein
MPLLVWIAVAIAIVLIAAATSTGIIASPVITMFNGPLGYIVTAGALAIIGIIIWKKTSR